MGECEKFIGERIGSIRGMVAQGWDKVGDSYHLHDYASRGRGLSSSASYSDRR